MSNETPQTTDENAEDLGTLKAFLESHTDIEAALNHRFEYCVWYRGHDSRFSHQRHEEIMVKIGEFIFQNGVGECCDQDPLYVFREYELWLELQALPSSDEADKRRRFRMKSFSLDLTEDVEFVRTRSSETKSAPQD
jgi:hypothetical protein